MPKTIWFWETFTKFSFFIRIYFNFINIVKYLTTNSILNKTCNNSFWQFRIILLIHKKICKYIKFSQQLFQKKRRRNEEKIFESQLWICNFRQWNGNLFDEKRTFWSFFNIGSNTFICPLWKRGHSHELTTLISNLKCLEKETIKPPHTILN